MLCPALVKISNPFLLEICITLFKREVLPIPCTVDKMGKGHQQPEPAGPLAGTDLVLVKPQSPLGFPEK